MFNYKDQIVAVVGASSGLGRQMAKAFARACGELVIMAKRRERLEELKEEIVEAGGKAHVIEVDVMKDQDIKDAVETIV